MLLLHFQLPIASHAEEASCFCCTFNYQLLAMRRKRRASVELSITNCSQCGGSVVLLLNFQLPIARHAEEASCFCCTFNYQLLAMRRKRRASVELSITNCSKCGGSVVLLLHFQLSIAPMQRKRRASVALSITNCCHAEEASCFCCTFNYQLLAMRRKRRASVALSITNCSP